LLLLSGSGTGQVSLSLEDLLTDQFLFADLREPKSSERTAVTARQAAGSLHNPLPGLKADKAARTGGLPPPSYGAGARRGEFGGRRRPRRARRSACDRRSASLTRTVVTLSTAPRCLRRMAFAPTKARWTNASTDSLAPNVSLAVARDLTKSLSQPCSCAEPKNSSSPAFATMRIVILIVSPTP
jgi:hypothetical protein